MDNAAMLMAHARHGLLVFVAVAGGCAVEPARAASTAPPRAVHAIEVGRTASPVITEVVGTVRAARSATVAAMISGTIAELHVGLGSSVRRGQVLVKLAVPEVEARVEQARAALALAEPQHERAAQLRQHATISASEYDAAVSQWSIAQARLAEASAIAGHAVLRAPFAGVITAKPANVGDTALPGQPVLVLEAGGAFRFEARVPEALAADALAIGKPVKVRLEGFEDELAGSIAEIQPASDEATRTCLVKIDLPARPGLRSGRFGRLLLVTEQATAITVPAAAVVRRGQLEGAFVVDKGVARLRLIRTGRAHDGRLEIASGLSGGELVVLPEAAPLIDGQRVEVVP